MVKQLADYQSQEGICYGRIIPICHFGYSAQTTRTGKTVFFHSFRFRLHSIAHAESYKPNEYQTPVSHKQTKCASDTPPAAEGGGDSYECARGAAAGYETVRAVKGAMPSEKKRS